MNKDFAIKTSFNPNDVDKLKVFLVMWPDGDDGRLVLADSKDQADELYTRAAHAANPNVQEFGLMTVSLDELWQIHGDLLAVFAKYLQAVPNAMDSFIALGVVCGSVDDFVQQLVTFVVEALLRRSAQVKWLEERIKAIDAELASHEVGEGFDPGKHFAAQARRDAFVDVLRAMQQDSNEKAVSG